MNNTINNENWRSARFKNNDLLAFIDQGGDLDVNGNFKEIFIVVVSNSDYQEVSDQVFDDLSLAIQAINNRFSHWELTDNKIKNSSGCDSCAAH